MPYYYFDVSKRPFVDSEGEDYAMRRNKYAPNITNHYEEPLGLDLINISPEFADFWGDIMDSTRDMWNDVNNYHSSNQVCYRHYKLSPDPKDNITLEEFREYCQEYCKRVYEDRFEIAIVYHNDNKEHILHAHIYVNSPIINKDGLEPGTNYISTYFKEELYPGRFQWHMALREHLAFERGWHSFLEEDVEDLEAKEMRQGGMKRQRQKYEALPEDREEREMLFDADRLYFEQNYYYNPAEPYQRPYLQNDSRASASNIRFTRAGYYYTKKEREIIKKYGTSQKEIIREKIEIAKRMAKNEEEFLENIQDIDLDCHLNKYNEYVFTISFTDPDDPVRTKSFSIQGKNLGSNFSRDNIIDFISSRNTKQTNNNDVAAFTSVDTAYSQIQEEEKAKQSEFIFNHYKIDTSRRNYRYRTPELKIIKETCWSKNEDIRQRIARAIDNSYDELSFIYKCNQYNIQVEITKNNDYKFHHPDKNEPLAVTGTTLGKHFEKGEILKKFGYSQDHCDSFATTKNTAEAIKTAYNRRKFFEHMKNLGIINDVDKDVFVMHARDPEVEITPKNVIKMLQINDQYGITNYDDYIEKLNECTDQTDRENLSFAQNIMIHLSAKDNIRSSNIENKSVDFSQFLFNTNKDNSQDNIQNSNKKKTKNKKKEIYKEQISRPKVKETGDR